MDHLHNLALGALRPPYTQYERESDGWLCVSDSCRKRQKMDAHSVQKVTRDAMLAAFLVWGVGPVHNSREDFHGSTKPVVVHGRGDMATLVRNMLSVGEWVSSVHCFDTFF
jgi:hypothetical protein